MRAFRICIATALVSLTGFSVIAVSTVPKKLVDTHDTNMRLCALLFLGATSSR